MNAATERQSSRTVTFPTCAARPQEHEAATRLDMIRGDGSHDALDGLDPAGSDEPMAPCAAWTSRATR